MVGQDGAHVSAEGLHILADEDSVLLGLIPKGLEMSCNVEHRVLQDIGRTDSCHSRVIQNQQYLYPKFPPTAITKLL